MKEFDEFRLAALRFVKEWTVWMVSVEAVTIGFLVSLLSNDQLAYGSYYIKGGIICFGLSIAFASCVLITIPSISQRLPMEQGSIYSLGISTITILRKIRLGSIIVIQNLLFLIGLFGLIFAVINKEIG